MKSLGKQTVCFRFDEKLLPPVKATVYEKVNREGKTVYGFNTGSGGRAWCLIKQKDGTFKEGERFP